MKVVVAHWARHRATDLVGLRGILEAEQIVDSIPREVLKSRKGPAAVGLP